MQQLREIVHEMLSNHPLWGCLMIAVIVWYATVTIYIAIRGAFDIRSMLERLKQREEKPEMDADQRG